MRPDLVLSGISISKDDPYFRTASAHTLIYDVDAPLFYIILLSNLNDNDFDYH